MTVLVYTPTYADGTRPEMLRSVSAQTFTDYFHEVSWHNPLPGRRMENVVAQYQRAQEMTLAGGYDALLTAEHDMILPPDALSKLYDTDAPVVYGVYMLRHGMPTLNAWQYIGNRSLGMSLSLYPNELIHAMERGWAEVCGVGWGCTLIRREVLERLRIHSASNSDAGDVTFATECIRNGIRQIARFDVPCGHILPDGRILEVTDSMGVIARVLALQTFNAMVEGQSVPMKQGRYYSVPVEVGYELERAGYVQVTNQLRETADARPEVETATATVTKRKPKRSKRAN